MNVAKRLVRPSFFKLLYLVWLLWLGNALAALFGDRQHLNNIQSTTENYFEFTNSISRQIAVLHATWTSINQLDNPGFGTQYLLIIGQGC